MKNWIVASLVVGLTAGAAIAQTPAPAAPPPPPGGGQTPEDAAKQAMAVVQKFAQDHQSDVAFAAHEAPDGQCLVDQGREILTLTFNADGTLHCKPPSDLAEGYRLDVWVLTFKEKAYDEDGHYSVSVATGDPLNAIVHGNADDATAVLGILMKLAQATTTPAWWHDKKLLGPYRFKTVTLTVKLDEAGVTQDTKFNVAPLYLFNLGVLAIGGPPVTEYSIVDGKIASSSSKFDLNYYFGIHAYPLSWRHNGEGDIRPGRYFSKTYQDWEDRLSIVLGVNISDPKNGVFLGGAIEILDGFSITAGWQPRKVGVLASGVMVGDTVGMDVKDAPTVLKWDTGNWGVGISFDATALLPVFSIFK